VKSVLQSFAKWKFEAMTPETKRPPHLSRRDLLRASLLTTAAMFPVQGDQSKPADTVSLVHVDIKNPINSFDPDQALGSSIDVPGEARLRRPPDVQGTVRRKGRRRPQAGDSIRREKA
jgi:hypothetical protein